MVGGPSPVPGPRRLGLANPSDPIRETTLTKFAWGLVIPSPGKEYCNLSS